VDVTIRQCIQNIFLSSRGLREVDQESGEFLFHKWSVRHFADQDIHQFKGFYFHHVDFMVDTFVKDGGQIILEFGNHEIRNDRESYQFYHESHTGHTT